MGGERHDTLARPRYERQQGDLDGLACADEAALLDGRPCCCHAANGSGWHDGACCPECGPLATLPDGLIDVLAGYVRSLACSDALCLLPTDRDSVHRRIGDRVAHAWSVADLRVHTRAARDGGRARYDGDG